MQLTRSAVDPNAEACRIFIQAYPADVGGVGVSAPMKHKDLCYDILRDARIVINSTPDFMFRVPANLPKLVAVMNMSGTVDVIAPLPPKEICFKMLDAARKVIEAYGEKVVEQFGAYASPLKGDA